MLPKLLAEFIRLICSIRDGDVLNYSALLSFLIQILEADSGSKIGLDAEDSECFCLPIALVSLRTAYDGL